jgi:hypothetical protein
MVAPAGVNEEIPREPVKAGPTGAQPMEGEPAPAPEGALAEAVPRQADPQEMELAEASHAELADAELADAKLAKAELAKAELAKAELAKAELAKAELAKAERTEGEPADAELAEAGPADAELTDVEPGGPDWDAAEKRRDVNPLAVAAIILGVMALVGAAVGVLAVITHGFRPKTVITYRPAAVFALRPGECINSAGNGLNVTVLSCATPHDAEVFATFSLPAGTWPGASAVQQDAGNGCASRLASYLNPQLATADLTQEYVYPNQAAWRADERTVVCEVRAVSGQLTGSVRAPN